MVTRTLRLKFENFNIMLFIVFSEHVLKNCTISWWNTPLSDLGMLFFLKEI